VSIPQIAKRLREQLIGQTVWPATVIAPASVDQVVHQWQQLRHHQVSHPVEYVLVRKLQPLHKAMSITQIAKRLREQLIGQTVWPATVIAPASVDQVVPLVLQLELDHPMPRVLQTALVNVPTMQMAMWLHGSLQPISAISSPTLVELAIVRRVQKCSSTVA